MRQGCRGQSPGSGLTVTKINCRLEVEAAREPRFRALSDRAPEQRSELAAVEHYSLPEQPRSRLHRTKLATVSGAAAWEGCSIRNAFLRPVLRQSWPFAAVQVPATVLPPGVMILNWPFGSK